MRLSLRVTLAFLALCWAFALMLAASGAGVEALAILVLVGAVGLREVMARGAPEGLRARMGVFVFLGALAAIFVVVRRVRDVLNL